MYQLSKNIIDIYIETFQLFDKNDDGHITFKEFYTSIKSFIDNITKSELEILFFLYAKNNLITVDNFITIIQNNINIFNNVSELELISAYEVFDVDKDGFISAKDYKIIMQKLGDPISDEELKNTFIEFGLSLTDYIDYKLFKYLLRDINIH